MFFVVGRYTTAHRGKKKGKATSSRQPIKTPAAVMSGIDDCLALLQGNELESSLRRRNMNIHEAVLLPLMIKEIFNIQISACQVINKEQARRNMEMELGKI